MRPKETESIPSLFVRALADSDGRMRAAARAWLGLDAHRDDLDCLLALIAAESTDISTRRAAGREYSRRRDATPDPLIELVRERRSIVAIETLGWLGRKAAVEVLLPLVGDAREHVRIAAQQALGHLGDARAVEPLLNRFQALDEQDGEKHLLAEVLGILQDRDAVPALIAAIPAAGWDRQGPAPFRIFRALGRLGDERAADPLAQHLSWIDGDYTRDEEGDYRWHLCAALARVGGPIALAALGTCQQRRPWIFQRHGAIRTGSGRS
jgi:HEAT repeat protein